MRKGEYTDLTGKKFGRWKVIKFAESKDRKSYWLCKCVCGTTKIIYAGSLKKGLSKSCGCIQKESPAHLQHGLSHSRFYRIWGGIRNRCLNPKQINYGRYGAKGIKICQRWLKFENFRQDMHASYLRHSKKLGEKNTTIERRNSKGNYSKLNCHWATYKQQNLNRSNNI